MLSSSKLGWTCHGCLILFGAKDRRQLAENLILSSEANIALAMQELVQSCSISKHVQWNLPKSVECGWILPIWP